MACSKEFNRKELESLLSSVLDDLDQLESCQRLKLKAVKMEQELLDNDNKLKELEEAEVVYCSPETLENIRSKQFLLRMDDRLIGIVVDESHCVVSW